MRCHDDSTVYPLWSQRHIREIVERAPHPAFRLRQRLIGRQVQASLDLSSLQDLIVFAAHDICQSRQIGENGSCPILSIQAHQHTLFGMLMRLTVGLDSCDCLAELCSVGTVARVSKRAEPLMGMSV